MAGGKRAAAIVLTGAALLAGCATNNSPQGPSTAGNSRSVVPSASTTPGTPTPATPRPGTPTPSPSVRAATSPAEHARQAMAKITRGLASGAISVAVRDETTGATFAYGARSGMWMGSTYKLLVLETMLLRQPGSGAWFTGGELADITAMIEQSDNKAGYRMFLDAGGSSAVAGAARRLGMRHTVMGSTDPTFTRTSARDALKLLECLVQRGPLPAKSQAFVLSLMRSVESDQRWGVGVLADPGTTFANKNGWLAVDDDNGPGEDDDSRWVVNSLGIVRVHGDQLLVSVFTEHDPDLDTGIRLVQKLARLAASAVLPPTGDSRPTAVP